MRSFRSYLVIFCGVLLTVSCETEKEPSGNFEEPQSKTLRLNFHDNLLELNPLEARSRSEEFLKDLVFDQFIEQDLTSPIFESYQFDSLQGIYTFQIKSGKRFHDGGDVTSETIRNFLKHLIEYQYEVEPINLLFSSMEGFGLINWYRENRNVLDSIPKGFQIIDEKSFSIKLRNNKDQLLHWFQYPMFTLFKENNGSYVGSGSFELAELNEDISAKLTRKDSSNSNIQTILLSFIKNQDLVYAEFFRGALDLISYQPTKSHPSPQTERLDKLLRSQYPEYQVAQSKRSIVKYVELKHMYDSVLLQKVLASLNIISDKFTYLNSESKLQFFDLDSLSEIITSDTTFHKIQWYVEASNDSNFSFTNTPRIEFVKTNLENINQTEPHIVIKEMEVEFWVENDKKTLTMELAKKYESKENSIFMVLEAFPEYVIYNNKLKGVNTITDVSELAKTAYYQSIKTY
ncbi:ABC transporter substrate-binding protein [Reichenbachiella sp.]|uniref:ABC transporter substrate-binding protein n=1 Tax=Reichenbachiella sp. TaxID=2184521 RepID=UPI003BB106FD